MIRKLALGSSMLVVLSVVCAGAAHSQTGGSSGTGTSPTQAAPNGPDVPNRPTASPPTTGMTPAAAPAATGTIGDVVVTARRVHESLQTVPVAVTAITAKDLAQRGAVNVTDVAKITPNLSFSPQTVNPGVAFLTIRGQVQNDNLITLDPSVGVYVNDVYFARAYSELTDLLDVADVEVLKGPQGTLYGRNTIGGAIKITTQTPKTSDDVNGYLTLGGGNYSTFSSVAAVTLPVVKDVLAVRLAASHVQHDGYTTSYLVDQPSLTPLRAIGTDDKDTTSLRGTVVFTPLDKLNVTLISSYFQSNNHGGLSVNQAGDVVDINGPGYTNEFNSAQRASNFYSGLTPIVPGATIRTTSDTLTATYNITPTLTSKVILGYVDARNYSRQNTSGNVTDSVALVQFTTALVQQQNQFSGEYQLLGTALDGRLNYIAGIYYFEERGFELSAPGTQTLIFGQPATTDFNGSAHNESKSAYFNVGYKLTPRLTVNGGVRYTEDTKGLNGHNLLNGVCIYTSGPGIETSTTPGGPCTLSRVDHFSYISFEGDADYRFTNNIFGYFKAANGYRSGGEQLRAISTATSTPYQPDQVLSYEVGLKNQFFNHRVTLNGAYFHSDYSNVQITQILSPGAPPDPNVDTTTTIVINSGEATVNGVELEGVARVTPRLTLQSSVGYTDFEFNNPTQHALFTPHFKDSISASYDQPFGWGDVVGRLDFNHTDHQNASILRAVAATVPSFETLDGRLTANLPNKVSLSAYAQNMLGEKYYVGGTPSANLLVSGVGAPRTYGVEASYHF